MIAHRDHHVAPPLVRHFVRLQKLGKEGLLATLADLRRELARIQIGQSRKINQAREAFARTRREWA